MLQQAPAKAFSFVENLRVKPAQEHKLEPGRSLSRGRALENKPLKDWGRLTHLTVVGVSLEFKTLCKLENRLLLMDPAGRETQ